MNFTGLESIGKSLRRKRHALGLSQDAVASKAGVTQAQISSMERGANVRMATTVAVLRALGLEMVFVPRELLPAIEALIGGDKAADKEEKPLYALDDED